MAAQYPIRNFLLPAGYQLPVLQNDNYTNSIVNGLYTYFSMCYAQRVNKLIQNKKKGIIGKFNRQNRYLLMALYVMRNWYNSSGYPICTLTIQPSQSGGIYLNSVPQTSSTLIATVTAGTTAQQLAEIQSTLPAGWSAALGTIANTIVITTPYNTIGNNGLYFTGSGILFPFSGAYLNPAIPYSVIQQIIENCIKICGSPNNANLTLLTTDNFYTSIGQRPPASINGVTNYTDNLFFV